MDGFVLNKKVGDYDSGWNHRKAYTRIYDPRGFEFEITVENLLYILEHCNSIKGKGLEGQFVYGWDGKDLVLLPVDSPDYREIQAKNKIIHNNEFISKKELEIGCTYRDINGAMYVYLAKSKPFEYQSNRKFSNGWQKPLDDTWMQVPCVDSEFSRHRNVQKKSYYYWFAYICGDSVYIEKFSNPKFVEKVSNTTENFQTYTDYLNRDIEFCPYDLGNEYVSKFSFDEFKNRIEPINTGERSFIYCRLDESFGYDMNQSVYINIYNNGNEYETDVNCYYSSRKSNPLKFKTAEEIYEYYKPRKICRPLMNGIVIEEV